MESILQALRQCLQLNLPVFCQWHHYCAEVTTLKMTPLHLTAHAFCPFSCLIRASDCLFSAGFRIHIWMFFVILFSLFSMTVNIWNFLEPPSSTWDDYSQHSIANCLHPWWTIATKAFLYFPKGIWLYRTSLIMEIPPYFREREVLFPSTPHFPRKVWHLSSSVLLIKLLLSTAVYTFIFFSQQWSS